jgi:hypothetical protein
LSDEEVTQDPEPEPAVEAEPEAELYVPTEPDEAGEPAEGEAQPETEENPAEEAEGADTLDPDKEISFTVRVNGKDSTEKATLHELIDSFQKSKASDEKFREAAHKEKGVKSALGMLLGDPVKGMVQLVMAQHGCDATQAENVVDDFFIDHYARKLTQEQADSKLSPEARELKKTKAELEAIRKRDADAVAQRERQTAETHADEYLRKVNTDLMAAIKAADMNADSAIVKAVLQKIAKSFSLGREITADVALKAVLRERKAQLEELFKTLPLGELIEKYPEHADKLRKIDSDRLQKNRAKLKGETRPGATRPATSTSTPAKPRFVSPSDAYAESLRS